MEFTTHFGLHSQTTRLSEGNTVQTDGVTYGALTLSDAPFQVNFDSISRDQVASLGHNSLTVPARDFRLELFPLRSPLLRESLLVSFPPLIDMLKFSG